MWPSFLTITSILTLASLVASASLPHLRARNIVHDGTISDSYDFIIVGGGTAGLVLAARLSEDSNHTVLVLEAGHTGDDVVGTINVPDNTYFNSLTTSEYDWAYSTANQSNLASRSISWPGGKVLGGSSAINGMFAVRPPQVEVEAWQSLIGDQDGADNWSWESFYAAMKKSETFTAPTSEIQAAAGITFDDSLHGTAGPMHHSYPGYEIGLVGNWTTTLNAVGIDSRTDGDGGENWGAYVTTSFINPTNWTRSYTRSAYVDPLPPRDNLDILADAQVTRIIFEKNSSTGNLTATGVEWASSDGAATSTVSVKKEVIMAGGVIGTPRVLLLSGIGPTDVLEGVGITVQNALPGVGQHLQDHLVGAIYWSTDAGTAGDLHTAGLDTAEFGSYINSAIAYVNLTAIIGADAASTLVSSISEAAESSASLVPSQYSEVVAGYKAMYAKAIELLQKTPVGNIELLLSLTGAGTVGIQAGLQHPFSPGHLYLNSSSPFDYPIIDPGYLGHSADLTILREGFKLARIVGNTPPLSNYLTNETSPGSSVNSDEEWEEWIKANVHTEFHPHGTSSMRPLNQGGVVNAKLQVYGTDNVRVADASIFPIDMSCHLEAPTIGVAEKAAEIVRAYHNVASSSSSSGGGSSSDNGDGSGSDDQPDDSDAALYVSLSWWTIIGASLAGVLLF